MNNDPSDPTMKRCSRGEQCVHPDGCLLPLSEFGTRRERNGKPKSRCKRCAAHYQRQRYEKDPQHVRNIAKRSRLSNYEHSIQRERDHHMKYRDKRIASSRAYRKEHLEHMHDLQRRWAAANPAKIRDIQQRRQARKRNLPHNLTKAEWQRALNYFNGCCAYCGRHAGLWHTLAQEHFVPLSEGGGYTAGNIVPACHGSGGCNNSKGTKAAFEWLVDKFGKDTAKQIARRIADYFEWVNQQP